MAFSIGFDTARGLSPPRCSFFTTVGSVGVSFSHNMIENISLNILLQKVTAKGSRGEDHRIVQKLCGSCTGKDRLQLMYCALDAC